MVTEASWALVGDYDNIILNLMVASGSWSFSVSWKDLSPCITPFFLSDLSHAVGQFTHNRLWSEGLYVIYWAGVSKRDQQGDRGCDNGKGRGFTLDLQSQLVPPKSSGGQITAQK